uniref:Oxysterol-binding protein n=1 Tax=Oryzias sinensis TaxID=183150 RepID=A0A8C7XV50_9TELE
MDSNGSSLNRSQSLASGLEKTSVTWNKRALSQSSSTLSSRHSRQMIKDWEVIDDLLVEMRASENPQEMTPPGICEGYLLKRRKWPLKGWHKRYFVLDGGTLRYSKNQQDVSKGRIQGSLDVSLAVMTVNKKANRIDLDTELFICLSKAKSPDLFYIWVTKLQAHRFFKKNETAHAHSRVNSPVFSPQQGTTELGDSAGASQALPSTNTAVNTKVSAWLQQSHHPDTCAQGNTPLQMQNKMIMDHKCDPSLIKPAPSHGPPSVADSAAEYFDASDDIVWGSSSEVSDESGLSDGSTTNSEPEEGHAPNSLVPKSTGRRTTLPAHCPDNSHVGLMTILYNNIGKDLARVSMPAALNEPVNLLQRLCEELEYSELLDTACNTPDPFQRMVYIAAFAISGYSTATFRNRYKPFNPVLGETYECIREDRGFQFISEQVCHHPPISACHAQSENFTFWQDQRWKNKFWGKSLEIVPTGKVNVTLPKYGDHYEWNKVVTCIHNVLSQQRYLEHYGEVTIQNLKNSICSCKITFVKSRYWGSDTNKNEVQGTVLDQSGNVIHRFGGLWHEGIFCDTLPTPKYPQPKDYLIYYGFSTFAMELNELTPDLKPLLPPTDTRLRPDQRMLEEGKVADADKMKDDIEEKQRERRKELSKKGEEHVPRFFKKAKDSSGQDVWLTNSTYWELRKNPGFANLDNVYLW